MKLEHRHLVARNRQHFAKASEAAAWVIRTDAKLLGIPSIRPVLIEIAAVRAIGGRIANPPECAGPNRDIIESALKSAEKAAREAIQSMPPLKRVA